MAAAGILLDRGWGKAPTTHTAPDDVDEVRVTIRHMVEGGERSGQVLDLPTQPVRVIGDGGGDES